MASLTTYDGLIQDATVIKDGPLATMQVGLFVSNYTPQLDDVLADYTGIEATWTGYARQDPASWSTPVIDPSDGAVVYSQLLQFPVTGSPGGAQVYGYFCVHDGKIHHAELLAAPITPVMGTPVSILLRYRVVNP